MKKSFGARIKALFTIQRIDESFYEELEDLLIEGDLGAANAMELSDALKARVKQDKVKDPDVLQHLMKEILLPKIKHSTLDPSKGSPSVYLILGVNGVGKTTSIAKMAHRFMKQGNQVVLAAGDTFRAAAIDQLELHANRLKARIVKQKPNSDPASVLFDAIESAKAKGDQLVLADTAGRMHNKENLLRELQKIDKVIRTRGVDEPDYKKLLVIDATTGQNGISQAQMFHEAIGLDGVVLTKYDSAAKGGSLIQICDKLGIPITFVGVGESYDDLIDFDPDEFLNTLLGIVT